MKRKVKKFIILILSTILFFSSNSYSGSTETLNLLRGKEHDFENTYKNFGIGPEYLLSGKLLVLGDSYGFLLCEYSDATLNYIVHQGYNIEKINKEFIPYIEKGAYDYVLLYIGPNDYMEQTHPVDFRVSLQTIVNRLKFNGVQVILTNYSSPDFNSPHCANLKDLSHKVIEYDTEVKQVASLNDILYVETADLLYQYGYRKEDGIHPAMEMYNAVLLRVLNEINRDINLKLINLATNSNIENS